MRASHVCVTRRVRSEQVVPKYKHTMKGKKYILLLALGLIAMNANARQFEQGEKLYVNTDQSQRDGDGKFNWKDANANLFLYVWKIVNGNPSNETWLPLSEQSGDLYACAMPAGEFHKCIVVRKDSSGTAGNWNDKWNQTGDIDFADAAGKNCLYKFWQGGAGSEWRPVAPALSEVKAFADAERSANREELIHICPTTWGNPFSLRVKLKADKSDYDYANVINHGWYMSTDGSNWTSVDNRAGVISEDEGEQAIINNVLPASGTVLYYYLHSSVVAGRRLIKLTPDATGCDLDCKITFFGVASSEVNVNDTTYTLDGMVAFGVPCGDLVITCDGKSDTIKAAKAKSPQIFSIKGLPAATTNGNTTTAVAKFLGNEAGKVTAKVDIPNVSQGITYKHIDVLVGDSAWLKPTGSDYSNKHIWYIDGEETNRQGNQTSIPYNEANTTRYTYREFNPPAGTMEDLMSNGNYESTDATVYGQKWQKSLISDYEFWGKYPETGNTQISFYTDTLGTNCVNPNKRNSNGFAVVKNANNFFYTFAKVTAREGEYFALFDAASDGVAGKKAWYAITSNNPNLKLRKGTTYLFSFWAANINNYGEMDNAAKLQFQINGKNLGNPLDLGSVEFRNNRWHQCSATYYADDDADNVTISVINLNTNTLNTGNDFALDDIQFRAVSSETRSVRIQQVFEVQTHEPQLPKLTVASKSRGCDSTAYDAKLTVTYANPKGKLVIEDITTATTVLEQTMPAIADGEWDKQKTYTLTQRVGEDKSHTYHAYFAEFTKAEATAASTVPEFENCCIDGRMYRKWNNVLFIDNGDNAYKAFQWYKNGEKLKGEISQRYYTGSTSMEGTTDLYHCVMTKQDNTEEKSCALTFDQTPKAIDAAVEGLTGDNIIVYPTSVKAGGTVTLHMATSGRVQATLLTPAGQTIATHLLQGEQHTIDMPAAAGLYLLMLQHNETQSIIKINVY